MFSLPTCIRSRQEFAVSLEKTVLENSSLEVCVEVQVVRTTELVWFPCLFEPVTDAEMSIFLSLGRFEDFVYVVGCFWRDVITC
jgi:hypothetical protein